MKRRMTLAIVLPVLLGIGGGAAWYMWKENSHVAVFQTEQVTRGSVVVTISATGTVEPEEVVDVGAQVAGLVLSFGKAKDGRPVDYGSVVEEGTILTRIDDSLYTADLAEAEAQLRVDQASVTGAQASLLLLKAKLDQTRLDVQQSVARQEQAEANLQQAKVKLAQARRNWDRVQTMDVRSGAISQENYEGYQTAFEDAQANIASVQAALNQAKIAVESGKTAVAQAEASVAVGQASIIQAEANVARSRAAVERAQRNIGYCTTKSPVKGVIVDRRVNIGQTVVASLNAPSLFLIAKDLKRMQVWVAVNEADIGKIKPGQPVIFTVDAFPDETFQGEVGKLRLNASMTQNVVTYTVEITTDNSSGRLLPYLTANVRFEVARADNVCLVPSAALRWTPSVEQVAPAYRDGAIVTPQTANAETQATLNPDKTQGVLWVRQEQHVRPLPVRLGLSDGTSTEVRGEGLTEGMEIVTGVETSSSGQSGSANPFMPKMPKPPKNIRGGPPL